MTLSAPVLHQTILKLRMLDKSTSQIEWVAAGKLAGGPEVEISFITTAEHNLLTGRITSLRRVGQGRLGDGETSGGRGG